MFQIGNEIVISSTGNFKEQNQNEKHTIAKITVDSNNGFTELELEDKLK